MIYSDDVDSWKKYDGEWVDGLESGFGKLEFKNGDTFEGQFKDSSFNVLFISLNNSFKLPISLVLSKLFDFVFSLLIII